MSPPPPPSGPEAEARIEIDTAFELAGWVVPNREEMNLSVAQGIAVREFKLKRGHGYADYLLFVDGKAVGVLEAKAPGHTLIGEIYRLIKFGGARRVLFLVDRSNLGEQAEKEFQNFKPWTKKVWVYDHRTNCHYTLKTKRMTRADLDDFVACYRPGDIHNRKQPGRRRRTRRAAGERSRSTRSPPATSAASTCSGCGTSPWKTPPAFRTHTSLPRRSPTTSGPRSARSRTSWAIWKHEPRGADSGGR